jgi:hypothetical protein
MISVQTLGSYGKLGNQMFQYAAAYAAAKRNGTKVSISTKDKYRDSSINQLIETFELKSALFEDFSSITNSFYESGFEHDPNILLVKDNTDLRGYFQSEKYFSDYAEQLRSNEFVFRNHIIEEAQSFWSSDVDPSSTVSIHVRRGDYKQFADVHTNLGVEYYKKAISFLPCAKNAIVFSDDILESKEIIENAIKSDVLNVIYADLEYNTSLAIMSMCKHHVIANSSFSWWGSWLSDSQGITVAPSQWFSINGPKDWKGIYRSGWIVI